MEQQVLELKAQVFDIIAQQEMLQAKITQLNEQKQGLIVQLRTLLQEKDRGVPNP